MVNANEDIIYLAHIVDAVSGGNYMYYIRHYIIENCKHHELKAVLEEKYNISCCVSTYPFSNTDNYKLIFDLPENHPDFEEILTIIPNIISNEEYNRLLEECIRTRTIMSEEITQIVLYIPVYSDEELYNAEWVSVRCANSKIEDDFNGYEKYYSDCKIWAEKQNSFAWCHRRLKREPFHINHVPKWRNKSFMSYLYSEAVLFCSARVKNILEKSDFAGIEFLPVYKKSGNEPLDDIYQLKSKFEIPNETIAVESDMDVIVCENCGMKKLAYKQTRGRYGILKNSISKDIDFYETSPMFLASSDEPFEAHHDLIISQRLYRFIKDNHMDTGLFFEVIEEL
ncbi:MAG: hypothetical protein J6Q89_07260 [Clostridia bacterium]|nr:hypothetical protein [Clostridia bacterium]